MQAELLIKDRIIQGKISFVELVLLRLPAPLAGCTHDFKYRLAFVVDGVCVKQAKAITNTSALLKRPTPLSRHTACWLIFGMM